MGRKPIDAFFDYLVSTQQAAYQAMEDAKNELEMAIEAETDHLVYKVHQASARYLLATAILQRYKQSKRPKKAS